MLTTFTRILLRTPINTFKNIHLKDELSLIFHEGLYISAKEFWAEYQKIEFAPPKEKEKLKQSLLKYYTRSSMRCTPFATFSGTAVAAIAGETKLILQHPAHHKRSVRVDTNYLSSIITRLLQLPALQSQLTYSPNNSIYDAGVDYRFAAYSLKDGMRSYQLTSVAKSGYIASLLALASQGAKKEEIAAQLMQSAGVRHEDAMLFVDELIEQQILVASLEPNVTGTEPLARLIAQMDAMQMQGMEAITGQLRKVLTGVQNPIEGVAYYKGLEEEIQKIIPDLTPPKNTLQVDLFLSMDTAEVQQELVSAITRQATDLTLLARKSNNPDLSNFIADFQKKHEDAEIPLTIALDTDLGISYAGVGSDASGGGEVVDGLAIDGGAGGSNGTNFDYIQQFVFASYHDYLKNRKTPIEIKEEELNKFKKQAESFHFPRSMYLFGSLFKKDGLLGPENFTFDVNALGGPSGANLLGRFAHGDAEIEQFIREITAEEEKEHPEAIYAEVVHLPEARMGNILLRPVFRNYEIPYIGLSGAPQENQLPVDDLMVSVQNGEVVLRSKRLNKRIIPRMTTAHNFSQRSLPIYKFLCDLQSQGYYHPNVWDWGNLSSLKHLPRVTYKNLIIKKAQWRIEEKDISELPKNKDGYVAYFRQFRERLELPQRIVYTEGDNDLLIDFEQPAFIDLFLHYVKKYKTIQLEEFLFTEENSVVKDVNGDPFTNEMIIPLKWEGKTKQATPLLKTEPASNIQRKFIPGSEWLYFKIYCGPKQAEKILKEIIMPFASKGKFTKLFEQFFFIRYKDDSHHLRVRFYNADITKHAPLQQEFMELLQPPVTNGLIHKIVVDTYTREIERYGGDKTLQAERLFYADSMAVLPILNSLSGLGSDRTRLLAALRGIDVLLNDFRLDTAGKKELLRQMQLSYFNEFGGKPELQKQLNAKYRDYQKSIPSFLEPKNDITNGFFEIGRAFKNRTKENAPVIEALAAQLKDRNGLFDLLPSYIHMFMNRLFIAQQRKYELVVYHFLEKYYTSEMARQKANE